MPNGETSPSTTRAPVRATQRSRIRLACCVAIVIAGCGRHATREDCESIVDRNVEVQLKALGVNDSALVQKRKEELRASMKNDIETCVGKRVTDGMMACVRSAETADQIDKCLR